MATVAEMETRARALVDQDDANFPTAAQYLEFISSAAQMCWGELIANGWSPSRTVATPTINGSSSYLVAQAVEQVTDVFYVRGGVGTRMKRLPPEAEAAYLDKTGEPNYYELYWDPATGMRIRFLPNPASGDIRVTYIPGFTRFTASSDTWYGPACSDEYIVLAAALAATRKEGDTEMRQAIKEDLGRVAGDMIRRLAWMDARNPSTIRDVYGSREGVGSYGIDDIILREGL